MLKVEGRQLISTFDLQPSTRSIMRRLLINGVGRRHRELLHFGLNAGDRSANLINLTLLRNQCLVELVDVVLKMRQQNLDRCETLAVVRAV